MEENPFDRYDENEKPASAMHEAAMVDVRVIDTGFKDIDKFLDECLRTMRAKGHDYREGRDDDPLHNFKSTSGAVDITPEQAWYVLFYKHYSALVTYIKEGGQKESEPISSRIKDMIVYLLLFERMAREKTSPVTEHLVITQTYGGPANFKRVVVGGPQVGTNTRYK